MRKASNYLYLIGTILTLMALPIFVATIAVAFGISNSNFTQNIIELINDGKVNPGDIPGTVEEQALTIQSYYRTAGIIFSVFGALNLAKFIVAITAKRSNENPFHITVLVLSIVTIGPLLILASIFAIVMNKKEGEVEEINASY